MNDWKSYSECKPENAGWYRWRIKCIRTPGVTLQFTAKMRERYADRDRVLSPEFDQWTGWRVTVPETEWRELDSESPNDERGGIQCIEVEGVTLCKCPFCKAIPKINATEQYGSGITVLPKPQDLNTWWLTCCLWINSPRMSDPFKLQDAWNQHLQ